MTQSDMYSSLLRAAGMIAMQARTGAGNFIVTNKSTGDLISEIWDEHIAKERAIERDHKLNRLLGEGVIYLGYHEIELLKDPYRVVVYKYTDVPYYPDVEGYRQPDPPKPEWRLVHTQFDPTDEDINHIIKKYKDK